MTKIIDQIKDKAIGSAVIFMLTIGGTFLFNSGKSLWEIPTIVRDLKEARKRDSTIYMQLWIGRNKYQDSVNKVHSDFLRQDYQLFIDHKWVKTN